MENYEEYSVNGNVKKFEINFEFDDVPRMKSELNVHGSAMVIKTEECQDVPNSIRPDQKENVSQKKVSI